MAAQIFVTYAVGDQQARDLLGSLVAKHAKNLIELSDMSLKQPWNTAWQARCRSKIRMSDGVIVLLSKKTASADGVHWEMKCAREEGIPTLGVHLDKFERGQVPPELSESPVIDWDWDAIARFIRSLPTVKT
jgi:hypothetical protein